MNINTPYSLVRYRVFFSILISAIILFIGVLIYVLLRPSESVFLGWFNSFELYGKLIHLRADLSYVAHIFPDWFIYSLPNGLWALAYSFIISSIWSQNKSFVSFLWFTTIPVLVLGFEILQYINIINGTFCLQDISFGISGIVLGIILSRIHLKLFNYEELTN